MVASEKYFTGGLALCRTCGARPCLCPSPAAAPADELSPRRRRDSGHAIPFAIFDYVIPDYGLQPFESLVLTYLARETFGRGRAGGAQVSLNDVARALRLSRSAAIRALAVLESHGLVERTLTHRPDSAAPAATFIRVVIPDRR